MLQTELDQVIEDESKNRQEVHDNLCLFCWCCRVYTYDKKNKCWCWSLITGAGSVF